MAGRVTHSLLAEVESILTCIQEVPGANPARHTYCPDWALSWFPLSLEANARIVSLIRPRPLPSTSFPIHYSLLTNQSKLSMNSPLSDTYSYIHFPGVWENLLQKTNATSKQHFRFIYCLSVFLGDLANWWMKDVGTYRTCLDVVS
jgi:hypothetical protein